MIVTYRQLLQIKFILLIKLLEIDDNNLYNFYNGLKTNIKFETGLGCRLHYGMEVAKYISGLRVTCKITLQESSSLSHLSQCLRKSDCR